MPEATNTQPPCDNGKEKTKSLENTVFSRLFADAGKRT